MDKLINEFSAGLFFWQIILFVLLLILLRRFAWKPILKAVNDREEGIKNALAAAEEAKKEMQNVTADSEKLLQEARAEREAMLKEARQIKEKMIADAKEQAQVEGDKMIRAAQQSIEGEKKAAIADIKNQVASLSVEIAEKVLRDELGNKDKQLKLVDTLVDDIKLR
ncbi:MULTISPECIES: F0F1 ATP synthase subunit B [Robiginitalea]|uniref:ATP synthase subunit b n=1 Tax=Robiginitalea biformata (strain ATCC BAA-864 / DSM 15991 / KCTC 12146 / HTCC2501) TaxID=313596 RepID=A4CHY1_ROBBH|nr:MULTISPECIES: F0F1 ATP synthase subunit B [Robiginitalea]EAR16539.1 ATP synthase F0, subunit B [Robiginitalea biformata HTCC2501]MDC6353225.1 F0F1 ATP synthase subunit B [Robiginitalea sp. PM2]MDC6373608.1 F0F1 ATP synthase subunit B [Robiginitalea sp. SP8]